jgi:hypothetical protein
LEAQLSAGIVRPRTVDLNIPEPDCCGEAVEFEVIQLMKEENGAYERPSTHRIEIRAPVQEWVRNLP